MGGGGAKAMMNVSEFELCNMLVATTVGLFIAVSLSDKLLLKLGWPGAFIVCFFALALLGKIPEYLIYGVF
jgi:hypothetical protein